MIKIRLFEMQKHRNETTFRPFLQASKLFKDVGIHFTVAEPGDITFVGHETFCRRKVSYRYSSDDVRTRQWKFNLGYEGDYIFFDGQDSPSLYGAYDPLIQHDPKLLLKNSLYADRSWYQKPSVHGRYFWGSAAENKENPELYDYKIDNPDFSKIKLSGTNWLSTLNPSWYNLNEVEKDIDVFAMFSYPAKENLEFHLPTNQFYDNFRRKCINYLDVLPKDVKVAKLENGQKVPIEEYYRLMIRSKIVLAPFGYGEIAPRDLEAASVGAILLKPNMDHVETIPNPYIPEETYRPIRWDFSDMNDVILDTLSRFDQLQGKLVCNFRDEYTKQYNQEKLVLHLYNILTNLEGYGT